MLQYLIILLDDTCTSFCHYTNPKTERRIIPLETLRQGIRFGMLENLMIQFVYPDYELPKEYVEAIESIDHSNIKPQYEGADVWVVNKVESITSDIPVVLRVDKNHLFAHEVEIWEMLGKVARLNLVLTDVETFNDDDFERYKSFLGKVSSSIQKLYIEGGNPQLNLITDRLIISEMNNCGAGDTNITLAPNGKFYICPAFYIENEDDYVGDIEQGLDIKNKQLYKLKYSPICSHCDAYQCKRCVWLNRKTTLEVNTPSHEQCVVAHLERNASRELLENIRKHGIFLPELQIKEIDYLDPYVKRGEW